MGLGNPGEQYARTRHNVGWWLLDHLAQRWDFPRFQSEGPAWVSRGTVNGVSVALLRPSTYMNRSGVSLALLPDDFRPSEDLMVLVDDVTRPPGALRIRARGSAGGHNGLRSIEDALGHTSYARLRIGVGAPPPEMDLASWVLAPFAPEDEAEVQDTLKDAAMGVTIWLKEGAEAAMNRTNR